MKKRDTGNNRFGSRRLIFRGISLLFYMEGLAVENLNIEAQFVRGRREIISHISFCVKRGESLAIVGESGSGKSMTALALMGLLPANCFAVGSALLDGEELICSRNTAKKRGKELAYIAQSGAEFLNPSLKIKTQIYESLKLNGVKGRKNITASAEKHLRAVGFENCGQILEKYPFELSGGQAQRAMLAIALCAQPKLIIADEATKGIDRETANELWDMMERYFSCSSRIYITHNMDFAAKCNNILVLKDGKMREYGPAEDVMGSPESDYTRELIAAIPKKRSGICF